MTITHDLMLLDSVADLVFAMKCGQLVIAGAPERVLVERVLSDVYDVRVRSERPYFGH